MGLQCKVAQLGLCKVAGPSLAQILQFYVFFMEKRMKGDWTKSSRRAHFWGFAVSNYGVAFWAFFLFVVAAPSAEPQLLLEWNHDHQITISSDKPNHNVPSNRITTASGPLNMNCASLSAPLLSALHVTDQRERELFIDNLLVRMNVII